MCSQATESMEQQDYGKMEESLLSLDKELNPKKSSRRNDSSEVHGMLRLAGLVVRQAARSLLQTTHQNSGVLLTVELRQDLHEFATMLNSVHDAEAANLLNNYNLGKLVQRITESLSRDAVFQRSNETQGLMHEIQHNFDERHRQSALVLSVLSILRAH